MKSRSFFRALLAVGGLAGLGLTNKANRQEIKDSPRATARLRRLYDRLEKGLRGRWRASRRYRGRNMGHGRACYLRKAGQSCRVQALDSGTLNLLRFKNAAKLAKNAANREARRASVIARELAVAA